MAGRGERYSLDSKNGEYFDGCPTYLKAEKTLHGVLEEKGVDAEVELVVINTAEEARELRFPGSPTIRVDGEDLFPVPERAEYALGCRIYASPEGLRGSPTTAMLWEALAKMEGPRAKGGLYRWLVGVRYVG